MTGERLAQMGWPYPGQPINVDFDVNEDSEQERGLVAWWPMIGSQGGWPVPDRAFYRYPMTPTNGPTWVADAKRGYSVLFDDGANEYLSVASTPITAPPFTISVWAMSDDATQGSQTVVALENSGADYFNLIMHGWGGANQIKMRSRGVAIGTAQTATGWVANRWYHLCGVVPSTSFRAVYQDGANKATDATAVTVDPAPDTVYISSRGGAEYFSGRICDARLYNRALTDTEVYNLYARPWELYAPRIYQQRAYVAAAAARVPRYGFTNFQIPGIV